MLPEEVMSHLESPRPIPSAIQERGDGCLYTILNDEEQIVTGSQAQALRHFLQAKLHPVSTDNVLRGHVACRGKVVGRCRVVIRADDLRDDFEPGSIVVSESTDPDLIGILKKAGGVLTEQGGVTSHAAIICRELNVPTIIGIEGLLERIQDGQLVEIDADRGLVTLLQSETKLSDDLVFSPGAGNTSDIIGAKAYNLGLVRSHGFAVPDFVLFKYDGLRRELDQNHDRNGTHLTAWTVERLGLSPDDKLAIRSSAVDEDRENGSLAGEYHSLLHVGPKFFLTSLYEFLAKNQQGQRETAYRGSIIVQRMIEPTYSGVCLTLDPRTGNRNGVIIEFVTGGNEGVTGGQVRPERLVIDRLTGDILEDERRDECESRLDVDVTALVRQFLTLESHFGKPLDIEWALVDRKLYILQARPIVHLVGETSGLN